MRIVNKILEEVEEGNYTRVEPLLHFIRSKGDIADDIDAAWEEETGISLVKETKKKDEMKVKVKVIKSDKREEEFSDEKLLTSVRKAMESAGNKDDSLAISVLKEIKNHVSGKSYILTNDLKNEVIKTLATKDSAEVAKEYMLYIKESNKPTKRPESKIYQPVDPAMCRT